MITTVAVLGVLLGVVVRTLVPYLLVLKDNPDTKFDRKFLVPALVSVLINLALIPFMLSNLPAGADFIVGFIMSYGTQDITRDAVKLGAAYVPVMKRLV